MFFAQATGNTPKCDSPVQSQWYTPERDLDNGADIKIFLGDLPEISPQTRKKMPAWTSVNNIVSRVDSDKTQVGLLPLVNAPAHESDTMWNVIQRCLRAEGEVGYP